MIYIYINWITMIRKFGKHSHSTYGTLNSCFDLIGCHQQCIPWYPPLEIEPVTTECRDETLQLGPGGNRVLCRLKRTFKTHQVAHLPWLVDLASFMCDMGRWLICGVSALHSVVAGSISGDGDHGMHCWWHPVRSKQLFSVPYVACEFLPNFLVMVIQLIYNTIYLFKSIYIYIYRERERERERGREREKQR